MAKKFFKRALSVGLSLVMCVGMIAPSFAAVSFETLQDAIKDVDNTSGKGTSIQDSEGKDTGRYGYGKQNEETKQWDIEAWTENDKRNVTLFDNVVYGGDEGPSAFKDVKSIEIKGGADVVLDLNGNTIDGGNRFTVNEDTNIATLDSGNGSNAQLFLVTDASLTLENGTITGGRGSRGGQGGYGGGISATNSTIRATNVTIKGNSGWQGGGISAGHGSSVILTNTNLIDNHATWGGGIFLANEGRRTSNKDRVGEDSTLVMTGGTFSGNVGVANGGGLYMKQHKSKGTTADLTDVDFIKNRTNGNGGGIYTFEGADLTMTNGSLSQNYAKYGGGIAGFNDDILTLNNVKVNGNYATESGGGIMLNINSQLIMDGGEITENHATGNDAGGLAIFRQGNSATLTNVTVTDNTAARYGGGIKVNAGGGTFGTLILGDGNEIHSNTSKDGASDIYAVAGATIDGLANTPKAPEGEQFDGWYTANGEGEKYEGPAQTEANVDLVGNFTTIVPPAIGPGTDDDVAIDDSDVPTDDPTVEIDDSTVEIDDPIVEIDDPAVPLASGPITRAQFIDYLWRHEGQPETDGVCTFTDVSEDHEFVLALAWAEQNQVAFAYDDGAFEPDELVAVAAVREFLGNFETVFGKQAVAAANLKSLTGGDGEAVLNCGEVLAEFFGA